MRSIVTLLFLFQLGPWSMAQPGAAELNNTDAQGRKQGQWSKAWPNGTLRYKGQFKDDKATGEFTHFDGQGRLSSLQRYVGDGSVSRAQHFHPNGKLMATGKYAAQKKDSTWNYFDDQGKMRKVERYDAGVLHGIQETYYANGGLAEKDTYVKGLLNGDRQSWFDNGNLRSEALYVQGEPEGNMVFYFPSGKKEIEGRMVNGDRDGTWYYFNSDGTLQLQMLYTKGELLKERKENGVFKAYYDDGQLMSEFNHKAGKREGPFVEYYGNGTWVLRQTPADPILGTPPDMERVLQGQTIKREGTYRNDQLEGVVKEYDEKGKLTSNTAYLAGEEVVKP